MSSNNSSSTEERKERKERKQLTAPDGTKTPRRVQWLDGNDGNNEAEASSTHALDEHGLDPEAFETLTGALERHRSEQHTPVSSGPNPNAPAAPAPAASRGPRIHYFGSKPPPEALPPLDTSRQTRRQGERTPPSTSTSISEHIYPPSSDSSPDENANSRDVAGNYIDPNENYGLPGNRDAEIQAASIVRQHTRARGRKGGRIFGRRTPRSRSAERPEIKLKARDFGYPGEKEEMERLKPRASDDVEREANREPINRPMGGGGLLSALLALYNSEESVGMSSAPASGMSTPASVSTVNLSLNEREREHERERGRKRSKRRVKSVSPSSPTAASPTHSSSSSKPGSPSKRTSAWLSSGQSFVEDILGTRPAPTRNAGGVFGPLIASTGNIAGVAAPAPSQIQPNVSRPGYHLSRYSLETKPSKSSLKPDSAAATGAQHHHAARSLDMTSSLSVSPSLEMTPLHQRPKSEVFTSPSAGFFENVHSAHSPSRTDDNTAINAGINPTYKANLSAQSSTQTLTPPVYKSKWTGVLSLPTPSLKGFGGGGRSNATTPATTPTGGLWDEKGDGFFLNGDEKERNAERERRRKRKKAEIYITRHVAEIIQRQEFICKLARAMMMFGGPSHRLQAQLNSTARVLDVELSCMYLPDVMLMSFDDSSTGTSQIKFIRQGSLLDLGKLSDAYKLYWKVIHDEISVSEASKELDVLMRKPQLYNWWKMMLIGGFCSSAICTVSFNGSFIDALAVFPMGALLPALQRLSMRNELYSNVFEITIATLFSFIAAALASTKYFCYSAIASSSIVLILPGFIVLCGALEVMSRNIVAGSVRMCYAVVYSLFLGFGLAMGAQAYEKITKQRIVGTTDYMCTESHDSAEWWRVTPSLWWAFLSVPLFSLSMSLRNFASYKSRELVLLIVISSIGWVTNKFTGRYFVNQNDFTAAVGAFAVGFVANLYARFFSGNAFVIMVTGILFQVPSGLGSGGLLGFVSEQSSGTASSTSYLSGFQTALQLISVAIGLTVGLGIALFLVHPIPSRKRQGGVFSL